MAIFSEKRPMPRLLAIAQVAVVFWLIAPGRLLASNGPAITTQPQSQSVLVSSNAVFNVVATGQAPLSYQWSFNQTNLTNNGHISGATGATLSVGNITTSDAGNYQVVVSNSHGNVTSSNAVLTVLVPAAITSQPTNEVALLGGTAVFSVATTGTAPLIYQWLQNGTNLTDGGRISGSAGSTLTISKVLMSDIGSYQLQVSNPYGASSSTNVSLLVVPLAASGLFSSTASIPWSTTNALAISAGYMHYLALLSGGTIAGWGDYDDESTNYGPVTIPAGLTNAVSVTASSDFDLALRADGSVVGWGIDNYGQIDVPADLTNAVAIATGFKFSLALRNDGTVEAWGDATYLQTYPPVGLNNVAAIAAGWAHSLALRNDGTVVAWGLNLGGDVITPPGLSNVVAIAAGEEDSLALRSDGTVVAWGGDTYGETNVPLGLSNVVAIAAGFYHCLALKSDGTVVAWGDDSVGQTDLAAGLQNAVTIAAEGFDSLALVQNPLVRVPPTIWWQGPTNRTLATGQAAIFNPYVLGSLPMSFQWYFNGAPLAGQSNQWLALNPLQANQAGNYAFVVSNSYGSITSAVVFVSEPPNALSQPASQSVTLSNTASFFFSVSGALPLSYQWYFNGSPLTDGNGVTGSAAANLILSNVQASENGSYQCIVTNNYGSDTSEVATLTVLLPPGNISVPGIQYVAVGNTAYFTVTASGTPPFNFQWQRDGTNINNGGRYTQANVTGGSSATFDIANVNTGDSDTYYVVVSNLYGQATSGPAVLSVGYPPVSLSVDPVSESVQLNGTATFTAFIGGTPPFTFNWQRNGVDIPADNRVSSTNETLVISPVEAGDAGTYTITQISNVYGTLSASGFNGFLTVLLPPGITIQPQDQTVPAGTNATFSISATSANGSISYQWYFNGTSIPWAQAATMTLTNVQDTNTGSYYVLLSNQGGSVTSTVVQLTVQPSAPWFVNPLQSQNAFIGQNVTLDPGARGSAPLSFQWMLNGTNLPGATSPTLNFPSAQTNNSGAYFVIVTNNFGSSTSAVATLIVQNPVQITGQPASKDALLGSNINFTVTATGTALNYQWYFNGAALTDGGRISGSAAATLTIANVQSTDAGGYFVIVSNLLSSATSLTASLTPQAVLGPSVRYVMLGNTNPLSPYLDWSTAATNIQDAVDAAVAGDSIIVSNGIYNSGGRVVYGTISNRVVINKSVSVESLNGPPATKIVGFNVSLGALFPGRCVYLTNGTLLAGFTLTGGAGAIKQPADVIHEKSGGAVWCEGPGAVISNCVLLANSAQFGYGGGAFGGTVINSLLATNTAMGGGGAASNVLLNCVLQKNSATSQGLAGQNNGSGGGAYNSTLSNCLLVANSAFSGGGANGGVLFDCVLTNNTSSNGGGAGSNRLYNCILENNVAHANGGGTYSSTLYNCTVVSNTASAGGTAMWGGSATNCIMYYNGSGLNLQDTISIAYCCANPLVGGSGNFTNAPLFVNLAAYDFHLQSNSPCINSGINAGVATSADLDGNPRIVGGTVDMGAYEYQTPSSVVSYAYLQQYGLPTDGSVDFASPDGTAFNVYQDWIAGLNPTNSTSVLQATPGLFPPGITVLWPSVSGRTYSVQRSTNLVTQPFTTIQSNIAGHAGTSSFTDTSATNGVPYFYRVGVQR